MFRPFHPRAHSERNAWEQGWFLTGRMQRSLPQGMQRNRSLAQLARFHGVAVRIRARGRSRALRRFYLDDATAELVRALAVNDGCK